MAENQLGRQQVLYLPEGSSRVLGREAQRINIAVAMAVANAVKTTLGPKGLDKMLVSDLGDIVITNDGATILNEINVEHPIAKIMVDVAKAQDKEVGDGTTTVIILTGELLKGAGELLEQAVHPTTIIKGYKLAVTKAIEILNKHSKPIDVNDEETLMKIALVTLGSKNIGNEAAKRNMAKLVIKAIKQVMEKDKSGKITIDTDFIKTEKKAGGSINDTELINGVLIDKEVVHSGMPKHVTDAKIALLDAAFEIEKTETDARIEITSPEQMQAFLHQEEQILKEMVEKVKKSGANVVFTQKGIDDLAQHYLAKAGIMAIRRVKKSDMEKLSKATAARIVTSLEDLNEKDLGFAGIVEEKKVGGEQMVFVENCKDPKSVTLFLRGGTQQLTDEAERAVVDAIGSISAAIKDGSYVMGGGAIEIALSNELKNYANEVGSREQLAIQKFADALETIPKTLAESAGMDTIETIVQLRNRHRSKEGETTGVDIINNKVEDMEKLGIYEPTKVKKTELITASEAAEMILRIDDMISSKGRSSSGSSPSGMPPGQM